MKFTHVIFESFFKTVNFAFINRLKIRRYILNYRSGDRFIFNDLFRILLERNSSEFLLSSLNSKERLLGWSADYWVFKILIHLKRAETKKVEEIFEFLISKDLRISSYYFELNLFRDSYSCILPSYPLKNID